MGRILSPSDSIFGVALILALGRDCEADFRGLGGRGRASLDIVEGEACAERGRELAWATSEGKRSSY